MGDYGKIGVSAGAARFDAKNYGKIGAEYTYRGDFDNVNNGYKLSANANMLIGKELGGSGGVYAGLEFGKLNCTQYDLGLMADYTRAGKKESVAGELIKDEAGNITGVSYSDDLAHNQSLKTGLEVGFSRNLCCDEDRKFGMSLMGGAEFYSKPEVISPQEATPIVERSNKLNKIGAFMGAKAEYSQVVNNKGHEVYFTGKCLVGNKGTSQGEIGIGFRF